MGPLARLQQLELRAPRDHFLAEADEALDDVAEGERFRPAAADCEHVRGEARLRRGVAPQLVEHDLGRRIALEVDDDPDALAVGLVAYIGNALDAPVFGGLGDLLDKPVLADLVRNFGEDDRAAVAAPFLDLVPRADEDRASARRVSAADARLTEDEAPGREVRAL